MTNKAIGMTKKLAEFIVTTNVSDIPDSVFTHAGIAFMDWLGVALAGSDDPLVEKLLQYAEFLGGKEQAAIIGHPDKKTVVQAALINGAASHALDYDDSLAAFFGHPTVTLFPGLLALSELEHKSGREFLTAYIIGLKVGTVIAGSAGYDHYMSGYHATSTMGSLASASACSRLLGLDVKETVYALGIAGTQAAGLKEVFGTMCKPFHAGRASEIGVSAAILAKNGFTSAEDILEGNNGLLPVLKGSVNETIMETLGQTWAVEDLAQKYHASCHATHSPIEAALSAFEKNNLSVSQIKSIRVYISKLALSAAFRTDANTGLEGKFCIPYCMTNALLRGKEMTGPQAFTDEKVRDPQIRKFMGRISTIQDDAYLGFEARVEIETEADNTYSAFSDILNEIPGLEDKKMKIADKFTDLATPVIGQQKTLKISDALTNLIDFKEMNMLTKIF